MTKPEKIKYIIRKSAEYFGITTDELVHVIGTKNNIHRMKRYVALIILNQTETSMAELASILNYSYGCNVSVALKKIREELSDEFYGVNKTKVVYNELLEYLGYEKE